MLLKCVSSRCACKSGPEGKTSGQKFQLQCQSFRVGDCCVPETCDDGASAIAKWMSGGKGRGSVEVASRERRAKVTVMFTRASRTWHADTRSLDRLDSLHLRGSAPASSRGYCSGCAGESVYTHFQETRDRKTHHRACFLEKLRPRRTSCDILVHADRCTAERHQGRHEREWMGSGR